MATQGPTLSGNEFLPQWEDLTHYSIIFTWIGLFSMDGIMVKYGTETELMEYVGLGYKYNDWLLLVRYTRSMRTFRAAANYCQLLDNKMNKGAIVYIDGRPKASGNIVGFINST